MKLKKILKAIWAHLTGERYVMELLMINASAWWGEPYETVRSLKPITKFTAIGYSTEYSSKIFFPIEITKDKDGVYEATVFRYTTLLPGELEKWVEKINEHPFL